MSRIGLKVIEIPAGVTVTVEGKTLKVTGPKGNLDVVILDGVNPKIEGNTLSFTRDNDEKQVKQNHGTTRANANNAIIGVSKGFKKELEIVGIGYRASMRGSNLVLNVGYSHEVVIKPLPGVKISSDDPLKVCVEGISKRDVGEVAAEIRAAREPEPYQGKGIHYVGEHIIRKEGKRAGAAK